MRPPQNVRFADLKNAFEIDFVEPRAVIRKIFRLAVADSLELSINEKSNGQTYPLSSEGVANVVSDLENTVVDSVQTMMHFHQRNENMRLERG